MIHFDNLIHGRKIAETSGTSFNAEVDTVISRSVRGQLAGGVVYKDYTGKSIAMHVASFMPNWINKDLLWVCFHYPLVQLDCEVVFGPVPSTNRRALEFDRKLGFKEVARIADVFPDGDLVVLKMHREDCRWIKLQPSPSFRTLISHDKEIFTQH